MLPLQADGKTKNKELTPSPSRSGTHARNGRVARQSLVKRGALGTARQKALGKKEFVHISLCSFEFRLGA